MLKGFGSRRSLILWQLLLIALGTTWLWAPYLNHILSYRTSLISEYEAPTQVFSWLFRLGDFLAATLVIYMARFCLKSTHRKIIAYLLLIIGVGMLIDPLMATTCHIRGAVCKEYFSPSFLIHAIETVVTATAFFAIAAYDYWWRKRLTSFGFVGFQLVYFGLFLSQLASQDRFNTFSQYVYQSILILWLAWFCRDFLSDELEIQPNKSGRHLVKFAVANWAFFNGILAILISFAHLRLLGRIRGLYFAGNNAWLAQHGVVVGVIMLYLSRHLARGEIRARQIFLFILGFETLTYSVITPNAALMILYFITFCILFVLRDDFDRGVIAMTLRVRLKDALFMVGALATVVLVAAAVLYRTHELSDITRQSINHFFTYTVSAQVISRTHLRSALLAHTISAFVLVSIALILWILFRPSKKISFIPKDNNRVAELLHKYSTSSEDYFKLWPEEKQYFWAANKESFIAYKRVGAIAFALADPIGPKDRQLELVNSFKVWCRARRLKVCFLPIFEDSLNLYQKADLNHIKIGASALIPIDDFLQNTAQDKWWRWQKNRAIKQGYQYFLSPAPHSESLMLKIKKVSDEWLNIENHKERDFALGYFDLNYLQNCQINYIEDTSGQVIAFTNKMPTFKSYNTATVDLLRYEPEANNAMPYLLYKTIEKLKETTDYKYFDLGFVPFVDSKDPVVRVAKILSAGRFSAKGLEQFKNKFNPSWQPNYLAYDGDLGDLALIAANLEKVMSVE